MSKNTSKNERDERFYFDDFDIENAKQIKHPLIKKAQENYKPPFDDNIFLWLAQQSNDTKKHFNNVLREMMAFDISTR